MKKKSISGILYDMESALYCCDAIPVETELSETGEYAATQCVMFHLVAHYLPKIKAEVAETMVDPYMSCCTTEAQLVRRVYNIFKCYKRLREMVSDLNDQIGHSFNEGVYNKVQGESIVIQRVKIPEFKELVLSMDKFLRGLVMNAKEAYDQGVAMAGKDEGAI